MAIGMYPIPPPDAKTLAAIFGPNSNREGDPSSQGKAVNAIIQLFLEINNNFVVL